jgi:hypothetical protein
MSVRRNITTPLLSVLLLGLLSATALAETEDHVSKEHRFVRITSSSLHPKTQKVGADEAFGWVNYSSKLAVVSFDAEVARRMTCTSRGNFSVQGDRLESGPIQGRQFAALCHLSPGSYEYRVSLRSGAGGSGVNTGRDLKGTIVVE